MRSSEFRAVTHLSGPTSITRLKSRKYSKDIYMFGDIHEDKRYMCDSNEKTKPLLYNYLDTFFKLNKNVNLVFDYLGETKFLPTVRENITDKDLMSEAFLTDTINFFKKKGCFSLEKESIKKCRSEYPNVRFHITDFRNNLAEYKLSNQVMKDMLFFGEYVLLWVFFDNNTEELRYQKHKMFSEKKYNLDLVIDSLKMYSSKLILKQKVREMFESNIINSQLKKVDKTIQKKIKKIIRNEQKRLFKLINEEEVFFKNIKTVMKIFQKDVITLKDIDKIMDMTSNVSLFSKKMLARIVDCYVISRIFKKFNDKETPYMKKIFIHMGEGHISFIREKLMEVFKFKEVEHSGIKTNYTSDKIIIKNLSRCLDMKNAKLPFFK